jgi:hypothetical protein
MLHGGKEMKISKAANKVYNRAEYKRVYENIIISAAP